MVAAILPGRLLQQPLSVLMFLFHVYFLALLSQFARAQQTVVGKPEHKQELKGIKESFKELGLPALVAAEAE